MSVECSAGNIPPGYKQTEMGLNPEDWNYYTFGNLYAEPSRNGIYKTSEYHGRGTRIVNMGEMFGFDFISNQEMTRVEITDRELAASNLQDGDLLFGRRSVVPAGAGKCSLVVSPLEPITFESSIIRVRLDKTKANPTFYYYFFLSPTGRSTVSSIVTGTNVKGIRATELKELKVPVPTKAEQEAIAEALSDADAIIESFEQLIVKKRQIKQGAMQELLIGRRRLAGFEVKAGYKYTEVGAIPEDWEVITLNSLGKRGRPAIKAGPFGSALTKDTYVADGYKVYGQEQVIRGDYLYGDYYISKTRFNELRSCDVEPGDILLSLVGTAGRVLVIPHGAPEGIINPRLIRFSFDQSVISPLFFKFLFETETYQILLPVQHKVAQWVY